MTDRPSILLVPEKQLTSITCHAICKHVCIK